MASNSNTSTTSEARAAAEEPGLNGDGATTQAEPTTSPPPPTKGGGKGEGKLKAGAKKGAVTTYCANCGEEGDARCGGCGVVYYCRKNIVVNNGKRINICQQVNDHARITAQASTHARTCPTNVPTGSHSLARLPLVPGALEVRRPSERLPCLCRRGRRPGAAG